MPTLGEFLKARRQARDLTLEQVAHATRVRIHYLRALEEDERENLPSAVQGRGYLRLYGDYLGLDVARLLAAWESGLVLDEPPAEQAAELLTMALSEPTPEPEPQPAPEPQPEPEPLPLVQPEPEASESQAILNEIGQRLRLQRETLGISLADVERHLRLRQHYILALERGALEQLPSPVQGRGMLSNYARFLNLDAEAILLRFADALQARRVERMDQQTVVKARRPAAQPAQPGTWRRLVTPDLLIGGSLFVLMLVFLVWGLGRIDSLSRPQQEISGTPLSISEALLITPIPSPSPIAMTATPRPPNEPGLPGDPGGGEIVVTPINTDPLQVYIVAQQRAWLRVVVDGKLAFQGRVVPGNAYPFSGLQQIELVTGNAAALKVVYNQQNLGVLGNVGQVAQLIFVPGSIITPTPLVPTVLPTQRPTLTLQPSPTQLSPTITPFIP